MNAEVLRRQPMYAIEPPARLAYQLCRGTSYHAAGCACHQGALVTEGRWQHICSHGVTAFLRNPDRLDLSGALPLRSGGDLR